jgi:hypothetical protein
MKHNQSSPVLARAAFDGGARGGRLDGDGGAVLANLHEEHPAKEKGRKERDGERKE